MSDYFQSIPKIKFEGKDSQNPLAFKYYNPQQNVLGKTIEDHLRMAVCYWHTFNWPGNDPFGGQTFLRPWMDQQDAIDQATDKLENAFSFLINWIFLIFVSMMLILPLREIILLRQK